MLKTIRARFSKGIIEPLEKVDIADGKEITVNDHGRSLKTQKEYL